MCLYYLAACSSLKTEDNLTAVKAVPSDRILLETGTYKLLHMFVHCAWKEREVLMCAGVCMWVGVGVGVRMCVRMCVWVYTYAWVWVCMHGCGCVREYLCVVYVSLHLAWV